MSGPRRRRPRRNTRSTGSRPGRSTSNRTRSFTRTSTKGGTSSVPSRLTITAASPTGVVVGRNLTVRARVRDDEADLRHRDISCYLDGWEKTFRYDPSTGSLSFPARNLSSGSHTVEIEAEFSDSKGQRTSTARRSWTFTTRASR